MITRDAATGDAKAWRYQWEQFQDRDDEILLRDWIAPSTLDDISGKDVLECGCGGGQQTIILARHAKSVLAFDPATAAIARERARDCDNVEIRSDDLLQLDLGRTYDTVLCIAVIHHTADPDRAFESVYRHCRPGGTIWLWCYSVEGNGLIRYLIEPLRKRFLSHLPRPVVKAVSWLATIVAIVLAHSLYRLPIPLLVSGYMAQVRNLSFRRNFLNIFDKLNAPRTTLISRERIDQWFLPERFENISIRHHAGISWSCVANRRS